MIDSADDRRLSVAVFSDSAWPLVNGVSVSVHSLVQGLSSAGHHIKVFSPGRGLPAIPFPWIPGLSLASSLRFKASGEFDLVHVHTPFGAGLAGLKLAKLQSIPVVASFHTAYGRVAASLPLFDTLIARAALTRHVSRFYASANRVVVPSHRAMDWLGELGVERPLACIPTATETPSIVKREQARQSLNLPANAPVLLSVARLAKEKNLDQVLDAFLSLELSPAHLLIVGDGPLMSSLKRRAVQSNCGHRVHFFGAVSPAELGLYYGAADALVLASTCETQGIVVREAGLCSIPAIVCHGSGAAESVQHNVTGLIVDSDRSALRTAFDAMLANRTRATIMGEAARDHFVHWSVEDMVGGIVETYRAAIRQKRTSRGDTNRKQRREQTLRRL